MKKGKACERLATPGLSESRCIPRKDEAFSRMLLAIQRNEALSQIRVALCDQIVNLSCRMNCLIIVCEGSCVITSLGSIPYKLTHERCRLGLKRIERMTHSAVRCLIAQECYMTVTLTNWRQQRC